jgi:hypothetical protein
MYHNDLVEEVSELRKCFTLYLNMKISRRSTPVHEKEHMRRLVGCLSKFNKDEILEEAEVPDDRINILEGIPDIGNLRPTLTELEGCIRDLTHAFGVPKSRRKNMLRKLRTIASHIKTLVSEE